MIGQLILALLLLVPTSPLRVSVFTPSSYSQALPTNCDVPVCFLPASSVVPYAKHAGVDADQITQAVSCFEEKIERRVLPITGATFSDCLSKCLGSLSVDPAGDEEIEIIVHNPTFDLASYIWTDPSSSVSSSSPSIKFVSAFTNIVDPPSPRSFIAPTKESLSTALSTLIGSSSTSDSPGLSDTHFNTKIPLSYSSIISTLKTSKITHPTSTTEPPPITLESKAYHRTFQKPDLYISPETESQTCEVLLRYLSLPLALGVISPSEVIELNSVLKDDMEDRIRLESRVNSETKVNDGIWFLWNGFFAKYYETSPESPDPTKPAVVLCHGFGGSGRQMSSLASELSKLGHTCHAPDLIGFGRSHKPRILYTQYLWSMYLSDFTRRFVESDEIVLGGNSIGGYTVMASASEINNAETSSGGGGTVKGVALFNSAGVLYPPSDYKTLISTEGTIASQTMNDRLPPFAPPPSFLLNLGSNVILRGLRPRIRPILEWLYPERTSRVTDELAKDILNDSYDFGASSVIISGGKLPSPQSANELLDPEEDGFGGPVIVCQGTEDPLNDAKLRADQFEQVRDDIEIRRIKAGHCVMDEKPAEVAEYMVEWMDAKC